MSNINGDDGASRKWGYRTTGRKDLERAVAARLGKDQTEVSEVVRCFLSEIAEELTRGQRVELRRFGRWELRDHPASAQRRNPKTGAPIYIGPRRTVRFKISSNLGELVQRAFEAQRVA